MELEKLSTPADDSRCAQLKKNFKLLPTKKMNKMCDAGRDGISMEVQFLKRKGSQSGQ